MSDPLSGSRAGARSPLARVRGRSLLRAPSAHRPAHRPALRSALRVGLRAALPALLSMALMAVLALAIGLPHPASAQSAPQSLAPRPALQTAPLPVLNAVEISATGAVAGQALTLTYSAYVPGGLGAVSAWYQGPNGALHRLQSPVPDWGQIPIPIRPGHLDGAYRLLWVELLDRSDPPVRVSYLNDGTITTSTGVDGLRHTIDFGVAGFGVSGNGGTDLIAPRLVDILREANGSYRFDARDDGAGVASVSVALRAPDGQAFAATTRAPGNWGYAAIQLMQGAPTGRWRVESITLVDSSVRANTTTYHRDGRLVSTDPDAPATHGRDLVALDFHRGVTPPPAPALQAIEREAEGVYIYRGTASPPLAGAWMEILGPDGRRFTARPVAPGNLGTTIMPLTPGLPQGFYRVLSVRLHDGATPANVTEYRRDGQLVSTSLNLPDRHPFALEGLDFGWWGGPLPTATALTGPAAAQLGQPVPLAVRASAGHGTPQGWLHLLRGAETLASVQLDAQGEARIDLPGLALGRHVLRAWYSGSAEHRGSYSSDLAIQVTRSDPDWTTYAGGGAVFAQSPGCAAILGEGVHPVAVRYSPSEFDSPASQVTIAWPDGVEQLILWGPMSESAVFLGGAGRSVWSRFVHATTRPLIRVVQRRILAPPDATIRDADEVLLRLRVQNFAATPGCTATLTATLRRSP